MKKKVIFDLGAHKGEDSDFYLRKGFRVIAVDASDKMCEIIFENFKDHPNREDLTIVNYAITEKDGETITFYENVDKSVWGTIFESWDSRNKKLATNSISRTVKTARLDTLINTELRDDETLEYVKIDIEGADVMALKSLSNSKEKPRFVSLESGKTSWDELLHEFKILEQLGYTKFKIVDQSKVQSQRCPNPSKEGNYIDYKFSFGSSGLFGDELSGEWLCAEDAIKVYKKIFVRYRYFGDDGIFNNKFFMNNNYLNKLMRILKLKYPHVGWYDTHCTF
ncbi:MAG: FkbM family methyltransferase [Chitinophagaceae bacterium]|nr:FkbM family methyltransferase [Chitinophagaceae bacterium]